MKGAADYRLLGDDARLRLLRVLGVEQLNVTELTAVLGLAQSGVSRHLGLLRDGGFVEEKKQNGFTYHSLADLQAQGRGALLEVLREQFSQAANDPDVRADEARLQEVMRLRKESFNEHTADTRDNRQLVPGRSWAAWSRALGLLMPPLRVADLGCGEGYLTIETARWAKTVVGIDRSAPVLKRAQALAERRHATNITWKRGELEKLPLADASVDVSLLSQALHHAADASRVVAEAVRVLVPGGRLLVLDLREHDQSWVREKLGDQVLGFSEGSMRRLLSGAGLVDIRTTIGTSRAGDPFAVLLATGTKPASDAASARRARKRDR